MSLRQRQEVQEVLRAVGGQRVEQELTQIDYRSGMLTDKKTPDDLPVATWRCPEFPPGVEAAIRKEGL